MDHFNDHGIGMEIDHLSALTRLVIKKGIPCSVHKDMCETLQQDDCTWEQSIPCLY